MKPDAAGTSNPRTRMTTVHDLQIQMADGRALSVKDLLPILVSLIEQDAEARAYLAEMIGAAAPPGEPGPAGVAWVPDLAVNSKHCIEIVRWFPWPADKRPPPTGVLSEDGIINAELEAQRRLPQIVAGFVQGIIQESGLDEARHFLEQNRDEIAKVILECRSPNS